ncbi:MAG TPA: response regulator [Ideonella sp.]|nr:response regulator [Ideonella sp.]
MPDTHHPAALRLLFVEDNEYLRETLAAMLEEDGREVRACATAEEALEAFGQQAFDVVISDVSLPGMSGIDLARRLLASRPALWIILSSGYALDKGLHTLGPNVRSLPKPFELDDMDGLLAEIRAAL